MKKINLKSIQTEILSREELKQIMGGNSGSGQLTCYCNDGSGFSPNPNLTAQELESLIYERCPDATRAYCS